MKYIKDLPDEPRIPPLFIHGPQGCGKTRNAKALCAFYKKSKAIDHYPRTPLESYNDVIVFSNDPLPGSVPFATAMQIAGIPLP